MQFPLEVPSLLTLMPNTFSMLTGRVIAPGDSPLSRETAHAQCASKQPEQTHRVARGARLRAMGCLLAILVPLAPGTARAALGEAAVSSVNAALVPAPNGNWLTRTSTLRGGTVLNEYVGPDGDVFALAWHGPALPNFRTVLGTTYYPLVEEEARSGPAVGRGGLRVLRADFVFESSGHAPMFTGKAWLPKRLPSGFSLERLP